MKNRLHVKTMVLAGVLFLGLTAIALFAAKKPVIRVAHNPLPFNLPSIVNQEQGLLAQEGFQVEYHNFGAGHAMTEAMVAGDLDVAPTMGATSTIVSKAGGRDIKVIGCYSQAPTAFALATRPDHLQLSELRGKTIALPLGTEVHVLLGKILAEQGLSLRDVTLVNLLIPDGITALQGGRVDGVMVVEPVLSQLLGQGKIEILRDGEGLISGMTLSVVPASLLGSEKVVAFQKSHAHSLVYMSENPEDVLNLATEKLGLSANLVKIVAQKYSFEPELTPKHLAELTETMEFLYSEGLIRSKFPLEDLF